MKDFVGTELEVGDIVAMNKGHLVVAKVIGFTQRKCRVAYIIENTWHARTINSLNIVVIPSRYGQHIPISCTRVNVSDVNVHDYIIVDGGVYYVRGIHELGNHLIFHFHDKKAIYHPSLQVYVVDN